MSQPHNESSAVEALGSHLYEFEEGTTRIGRHGQVYVMDWGPARVLGREDRHGFRAETSAATAGTFMTNELGLRPARSIAP